MPRQAASSAPIHTLVFAEQEIATGSCVQIEVQSILRMRAG